jgi:hypothetical protein
MKGSASGVIVEPGVMGSLNTANSFFPLIPASIRHFGRDGIAALTSPPAW